MVTNEVGKYKANDRDKKEWLEGLFCRVVWEGFYNKLMQTN